MESILMKANFKDKTGFSYLASSFESFRLNSLVKIMFGDRFTQVYFKTSLGIIYRIAKDRQKNSRTFGFWLLKDQRTGKSIVLTPDDIENCMIACGQSFACTNMFNTSEVKEIVAVNKNKSFETSESNWPVASLPTEFGD